jgi:hypothetical protein
MPRPTALSVVAIRRRLSVRDIAHILDQELDFIAARPRADPSGE